jgi:hypothetical protein
MSDDEKKDFCKDGICMANARQESECNLFLPVPGSALCSLSPMIGDPHKKDKDGCDIAVSLHEGIDE